MLFTTDDDEFDSSGCENVDLNANITLDKVHVHWTYKKGDNFIEMGYMNIEMLRKSLLDAMEKMNADKMTLELFEKFWVHSMDVNYEKTRPKMVFKMLDEREKGFLTVEDVKNLKADVLKDLARAMDPPHGPRKEEQLNDEHIEIKEVKFDQHGKHLPSEGPMNFEEGMSSDVKEEDSLNVKNHETKDSGPSGPSNADPAGQDELNFSHIGEAGKDNIPLNENSPELDDKFASAENDPYSMIDALKKSLQFDDNDIYTESTDKNFSNIDEAMKDEVPLHENNSDYEGGDLHEDFAGAETNPYTLVDLVKNSLEGGDKNDDVDEQEVEKHDEQDVDSEKDPYGSFMDSMKQEFKNYDDKMELNEQKPDKPVDDQKVDEQEEDSEKDPFGSLMDAMREEFKKYDGNVDLNAQKIHPADDKLDHPVQQDQDVTINDNKVPEHIEL